MASDHSTTWFDRDPTAPLGSLANPLPYEHPPSIPPDVVNQTVLSPYAFLPSHNPSPTSSYHHVHHHLHHFSTPIFDSPWYPASFVMSVNHTSESHHGDSAQGHGGDYDSSELPQPPLPSLYSPQSHEPRRKVRFENTPVRAEWLETRDIAEGIDYRHVEAHTPKCLRKEKAFRGVLNSSPDVHKPASSSPVPPPLTPTKNRSARRMAFSIATRSFTPTLAPTLSKIQSMTTDAATTITSTIAHSLPLDPGTAPTRLLLLPSPTPAHGPTTPSPHYAPPR